MPLEPPEGEPPRDEPGPSSQEIRHSQVSARVPERVGRGVFSTGAVVLQGAHEFIIDFLLRMTSPQQVAARIVLPPGVMGQFGSALRENVNNYQRNFGPVAPVPTHRSAPPGTPQPPSVEELYDQLKLPDELMSGAYANAVMIAHTATEFSFDFITTFYPRSAVSCRVFMAAPNVPRFLDSLSHAFSQWQRVTRERQNQPPPSPPPEHDADDEEPPADEPSF